jgi:hypothetical protein
LDQYRQRREDQAKVMPIFEIQDKDGKTYEVDGPDMMAAAKAFSGYTPPSTSEDVIKSTGSGIASGATKLAGLIPDLSSLAHSAANKYLFDPLLNATIGAPSKPLTPENQPPDISKLAGSANIQKGVESLTGKFYEPQTNAGKYAHSIGEAIPGSVAAPGSTAARLLSAVGAGAGSEALGQATEGTGWEPYARVGGALAGGLAPSIAGHVVTPIPATIARQRNVDTLANEGVNSLTAGQRTGSKSLQYAESMLGDAPMAGGRATAATEAGQRQFTEAAMRRAGPGLADATPETLAANHNRLTQSFRDLSARNTMVPDNQFITDVATAVRNYRNVPESQQRAMLQGYIDDIVPHVNAGTMPGVEYQAMRSRLSKQANNNRQSDPDLSQALRGMRNALDNAMERSIAGTPDAGAWGQTRLQYGAQKTLEKTASKSGEAITEGQIPPAALRNTVAGENRNAYARGEGQFSDLARAGAGVMSPLPNSGTAQRMNVMNIFNQALLGAPGAIGGRALMSRPVQSWLGNQLLAQGLRDDPAGRRALFQALAEASRNKLAPPMAQ